MHSFHRRVSDTGGCADFMIAQVMLIVNERGEGNLNVRWRAWKHVADAAHLGSACQRNLYLQQTVYSPEVTVKAPPALRPNVSGKYIS